MLLCSSALISTLLLSYYHTILLSYSYCHTASCWRVVLCLLLPTSATHHCRLLTEAILVPPIVHRLVVIRPSTVVVCVV